MEVKVFNCTNNSYSAGREVAALRKVHSSREDEILQTNAETELMESPEGEPKLEMHRRPLKEAELCGRIAEGEPGSSFMEQLIAGLEVDVPRLLPGEKPGMPHATHMPCRRKREGENKNKQTPNPKQNPLTRRLGL